MIPKRPVGRPPRQIPDDRIRYEVKLPPSLRARLLRAAEREGLSMQDLTVRALENFLAQGLDSQ